MNTNHTLKIFVVDDDEFFGTIVKSTLEREENIEVVLFTNANSFKQSLYLNPDLVIIDYDLPDTNGIEILKSVREFNPDLVSIILSGQKDLKVVVEAYKTGADRYIIKDENALVELIWNINTFRKNICLKLDYLALQNSVIENNKYQNIIGESPAMHRMFQLMSKVENVNIPVLINGENGTGKELVANALHYNSNRKRESFVAINVAAIPEDLIESELFGSEKGAFTGASRRPGKFEEAHKGTLFLDEIGDMPLPLQAKLLRVLQESKVTRLGGSKEIHLDLRVISATNKNLWEEVQAGRFREDLYFRLQGFIIQIPSLRDRENDILLIAKSIADSFSKRQNSENRLFSPEAIKSLMEYSWPGNVRELKSMIERAVLISDGTYITDNDLVFLERKAS